MAQFEMIGTVAALVALANPGIAMAEQTVSFSQPERLATVERTLSGQCAGAQVDIAFGSSHNGNYRIFDENGPVTITNSLSMSVAGQSVDAASVDAFLQQITATRLEDVSITDCDNLAAIGGVFSLGHEIAFGERRTKFIGFQIIAGQLVIDG